MDINLENLSNKVYEKLEYELDMFKTSCLSKTKQEIINDAYEIAVKEEIVGNFISNSYNEEQYLALLEEDNMLESLYEDWMDSEGGIHTPIEESIDYYLSELEEKYIKLESDPNSKMIKDMTKTLRELRNYDFCDDKIVQKQFLYYDKNDVQDLLNSKDGARNLLEYFKEVKDNKHLNYLKEIQVIDTESINKIDEYIPKLKEIINKNRNKSKDMER
jgi:hypothetical protein